MTRLQPAGNLVASMVATIAFTVCVARYYSITRAGRRQLAREQENWQQIAGVVNRVLKLAPEE